MIENQLAQGWEGGDMASFSCASRYFFFIIYLKNGPAIAFIMKAAPPYPTLFENDATFDCQHSIQSEQKTNCCWFILVLNGGTFERETQHGNNAAL